MRKEGTHVSIHKSSVNSNELIHARATLVRAQPLFPSTFLKIRIGGKKKTSLRSSWITVRFTNSYANTSPANVEDVVVCKRG